MRFYGYWDERAKGGYLHDLVIYFYLADDNIEVREVYDDRNSSLFIRKGKIPKVRIFYLYFSFMLVFLSIN